MANLVAIVGRPNVGKSTLFNRLTQSRRAIVSDTAGTTRDRQYGKCQWNGREFSVVDTGGWVVNSDDIFEDAIRKQVLVATEEADLVLFVVDNETGVTDWDEDVYVDMRSTPYQVWNPPGTWWKVRVVDAMGKAVSHRAKHYRGLLTRALLDADSSEIADVAACIGKVSVEENGRHKSLTLTVSDTP